MNIATTDEARCARGGSLLAAALAHHCAVEPPYAASTIEQARALADRLLAAGRHESQLERAYHERSRGAE